MTKICVFSDSHGYGDNMARVMEAEQPDMVLHLGDGASDFIRLQQQFPGPEYHGVQGNCDYRPTVPKKLCLTVEHVQIFAAHGHAYQVKLDPTLTRLRYAGLEAQAQAVLFGHTHIPRLEQLQGMTILNPGSIGRTPRPSYGILLVDGDTVRAELKQL